MRKNVWSTKPGRKLSVTITRESLRQKPVVKPAVKPVVKPVVKPASIS